MTTYEFECPRCGHCCQQRQWLGITDEEMEEFKQSCRIGDVGYYEFIKQFAIFIESTLKEKNA